MERVVNKRENGPWLVGAEGLHCKLTDSGKYK